MNPGSGQGGDVCSQTQRAPTRQWLRVASLRSSEAFRSGHTAAVLYDDLSSAGSARSERTDVVGEVLAESGPSGRRRGGSRQDTVQPLCLVQPKCLYDSQSEIN